MHARWLQQPAVRHAAWRLHSAGTPTYASAAASTTRPMSSLSDWWKQFKKEVEEEFMPPKPPPGSVNNSMYDPELWERAPRGAILYAFRMAIQDSYTDYKWLFSAKYRQELLEAQRKDEARERAIEAGLDPDAPPDEQAAAAAAAQQQGPAIKVTAEDIRAGALHAAKRLSEAGQDQELRARLAALGSSAVRMAKDGLDGFLVGYAEGKHSEVRAWLEEEASREEATKERVKKIRAQVEADLARQQQQQQQHMAAAAGSSSTAGSGTGTGSGGQTDDAKAAAAASAALASITSDPAFQTLRELAGTLKEVVTNAEGTGAAATEAAASTGGAANAAASGSGVAGDAGKDAPAAPAPGQKPVAPS